MELFIHTVGKCCRAVKLEQITTNLLTISPSTGSSRGLDLPKRRPSTRLAANRTFSHEGSCNEIPSSVHSWRCPLQLQTFSLISTRPASIETWTLSATATQRWSSMKSTCVDQRPMFRPALCIGGRRPFRTRCFLKPSTYISMADGYH